MLLQMNIIVQATAMAYIVSGENVVMREYSMKFILILKMEKNKQIHCIGILYSQTFLEGHYEIVIYSNVNTKSLMLFILLKFIDWHRKIHSSVALCPVVVCQQHDHISGIALISEFTHYAGLD